MCCTEVKLIEPSREFRDEFLAMVAEHLAVDRFVDRWDFKEATEDFDAYIKKLNDYAKGRNLPQGWVLSTTYWLLRDDNVLLGSSSLRQQLTPALGRFGGHIGYYIRPSQRRKGYGMRILKLTIDKAKQLGLGRVLVTCDDDNIASVTIIEKCGGVCVDKVMVEAHEIPTRRYWIEIQ